MTDFQHNAYCTRNQFGANHPCTCVPTPIMNPADSHAQPSPVSTDRSKSVTDQVVADLQFRRSQGIIKYGRELQSFNGRDALMDAYQEALDLAVYLRQAIMERDNVAT